MKRYLRPLGFVTGEAGRLAVSMGKAVPLHGGPLAFALVEVIERAGSGIARRVVAAPDLIAELEPFLSVRGPPRLMGIVNATPDSFSDGGRFVEPAAAIAQARAMIASGAAIIDIGGESMRPGAAPVSPQDEQARVLPVIAGIAGEAKAAGVEISVDTRNAATMRAAIRAGATMVNDVSALTHDAEALEVIATERVDIVLMHMRGDDPRTMQDSPSYDDVALDIYDYLEDRVSACVAVGVPHERIIVDPGIGFGKTPRHNLALLSQIALFHGLGARILVGVSRKGFLAQLSRQELPMQRLPGSLAAGLWSIGQGADILRVHDSIETAQALRITDAVMRS